MENFLIWLFVNFIFWVFVGCMYLLLCLIMWTWIPVMLNPIVLRALAVFIGLISALIVGETT